MRTLTSFVRVRNSVGMSAMEREALEGELRVLHERREFEQTAKVALLAYGPEILGLLLAVLRDHDAAAEVYAEFSANLWRGLPAFRWQSSFRTWAYTLARNAAYRYRRDPLRRRAVMIGDGSVLDDMPQSLRTATATFMKTGVRQGVAEVRGGLDPDDQLLLVLRVDRGLSWADIATIMATDEAVYACEGESQKRAAATLRKRFERLKRDIRSMVAARRDVSS